MWFELFFLPAQHRGEPREDFRYWDSKRKNAATRCQAVGRWAMQCQAISLTRPFHRQWLRQCEGKKRSHPLPSDGTPRRAMPSQKALHRLATVATKMHFLFTQRKLWATEKFAKRLCKLQRISKRCRDSGYPAIQSQPAETVCNAKTILLVPNHASGPNES